MISRFARTRSASSALARRTAGTCAVVPTRTCSLLIGGSSSDGHTCRVNAPSISTARDYHSSTPGALSLVDKFWDVVSPSNPLLADVERLFPANDESAPEELPNLSNIKPTHLIETAKQVQATLRRWRLTFRRSLMPMDQPLIAPKLSFASRPYRHHSIT